MTMTMIDVHRQDRRVRERDKCFAKTKNKISLICTIILLLLLFVQGPTSLHLNCLSTAVLPSSIRPLGHALTSWPQLVV